MNGDRRSTAGAVGNASREVGVVPLVAAAGWLGVAATVWLAGVDRVGPLAMAAVFGALTVVLARRPGFPKRRPGLTWSWVGPLLIAASTVALRLWPDSGGLRDGAEAARFVGLMVILKGSVLAVTVAWLFRGYGLIPFAATMATAWPTTADRWEAAAGAYPWRRWWVAVLVVVCLQSISGAVVYVVTARATGG